MTGLLVRRRGTQRHPEGRRPCGDRDRDESGEATEHRMPKMARVPQSKEAARRIQSLTRNHGIVGSVPGLAQWVEDPVLP